MGGRKLEVEFVLVRPLRASNVAAACRALKNMGFQRLCIVRPCPDLGARSERGAAYRAWDVLDGARLVDTLDEALARSQVVVATSARRSGDAWTPRELAAYLGTQPAGTRVSLVFGPEDKGLGRAELRLCPQRVRIPSDPGQPSLNLAQALLLLAYELRLALGPGTRSPSVPARPAPERAALEAALAHWREALLGIGYLAPEDPGRLLAELRRLLVRARPSARELNLLRGMARQVAWAGDVARSRRDDR